MTNADRFRADESYVAAQEFAASGRYADAIEAYSRVLVKAPDHAKARCSRALAYQQVGQHREAIGDFDNVIARFPNWSGAFVAYYGRAGSRQALGRSIEAIEDCDEAVKRNPDLVDAIYLRGTVSKILGQFEAAFNDMDAVLNADPTYYAAHFVRGTLNCLQGRWERAIKDFTAAIEHGISETESARQCFYLRGLAAQAAGKHRAAISDFSRAIELSPNDAGAYLRRSLSHRELGDRESADKDFQSGREMLQTK